MDKEREQKLVDITFEIALTVRDSQKFKYMKREDFMAWVARQLRECGYDTEPMGSSWGVLK